MEYLDLVYLQVATGTSIGYEQFLEKFMHVFFEGPHDLV